MVYQEVALYFSFLFILFYYFLFKTIPTVLLPLLGRPGDKLVLLGVRAPPSGPVCFQSFVLFIVFMFLILFCCFCC